jgi:hypothetical protein
MAASLHSAFACVPKVNHFTLYAIEKRVRVQPSTVIIFYSYAFQEVWYCTVPGRNATGYLQHRIGNVRRRLVTPKPVVSKSSNTTTSTDESPALSEEQFQFRKIWLKDFREPASQVNTFLDETFQRRRTEILDKSQLISFTTEWPSLLYSPESVSSILFDIPQYLLEKY